MKTSLLSLLILFFAVTFSYATDRTYSALEDFINNSDVIALVEVGARNPDAGYPNPNRSSKYRQVTVAKVKQSLKGEVPNKILIFHSKGLDDQLFQQGEGSYLVFSTKTPDGLTPFDGWPSSKPIINQNVLGWDQHPYFHRDSGTPVEKVFTHLSNHIKS